jgi:hypothetical protein
MKKYIITIILLFSVIQMSQSQILISLLLGDKLNTDQLKFGIEGGYSLSNISNLEGAKSASNFNIGFYFDILLKENKNWFVHTGVMVKSTMGVHLEPYSLGDKALDSLFQDGKVRRNLNYFNIPILVKYKFKKNIFIELGPMISWNLTKSHDHFTAKIVDKKDLSYKVDLSDTYRKIDAGAEIGLGYQLKALNGMSLSVKYYQGLMNTTKTKIEGDKDQRNAVFYVLASIPIGAGEKAKAKKVAAAEKKALKKAEKEKNDGN